MKRRSGIPAFQILLLGQLVSLFGTGLSSFGLSVWVYEQQGSVTRFAIVLLAGVLPGLLAAPWAGALVDRWDRRRTLIVTDAVAAVVTVVLAALWLVDSLLLWHIIVGVVVTSLAGSFQRPAILASVRMMVPKEQLGRANGSLQLVEVVPQVASPIVAGLMMVTVGLGGLLALDFLTFLVGIAALLLIHVPRPAVDKRRAAAQQVGLSGEVGQAWDFIVRRPGLLALLVVAAFTSFVLAMVQVTVQPLVLELADPAKLGLIIAGGNAGLVVGSLLVTAWGGPKRRVLGLLGFGVVFGTGIAVAGLRPTVPVILIGFFIVTLTLPIMRTCGTVLWQTKTPASMQGRVLSIRRIVTTVSTPVAYIVAGPLVDMVLRPMLMEGGRLANTVVGQVLGVGPGRGIALLFLGLGAVPILLALVGILFPPLRRLETELADADEEVEPAATAAPTAAAAAATAAATGSTPETAAAAAATPAEPRPRPAPRRPADPVPSGGAPLGNLWHDVRYALRSWRATPGTAVIAVVSLALAIGGNALVFGLINGLLWRPLPFPEPERVVLVGEAERRGSATGLLPAAEANFLDWRERQDFFEDLAGLRRTTWNLATEGEAQQVRGAAASPSFFDLLEARTVAGRTFSRDEATAGRDRVAVLTEDFARRQVGPGEGVEAMLGRSVVLDGEPYTVAGVLDPEFEFLDPDVQLYVPLTLRPGEASRHRRDLFVIGRLKEGVTEGQAEAGMAAIGEVLEREYPAANSGRDLRLTNLREEIPDPRNRRLYGLLQGALIFVLLIACANLANLLLARGEARGRERAVRFSLGATRRRIGRQLLVESGVVAFAGGLLGLGLGALGLSALARGLSAQLPAYSQPVLDVRVMLFTLAVTVLAALVFGAAPIFQSLRVELASALKEGGGGSAGGGRRRGSQTLVVAQIALALVLLAGSALLVRGVTVLQRSDPGFQTENLLTLRLNLPEGRYAGSEDVFRAAQELTSRLESLPGVEDVTTSNVLPRGPFVASTPYTVDGEAAPDESAMPRSDWIAVGPDYFSTLQVDVLRGRSIDATDTPDAAPVAVVNRRFATRHWGEGEAVGRRLTVRDRSYRVVGVVEDLRHGFLGAARNRTEPTIYLPVSQEGGLSVRLVLRTAVPPAGLADEVRREVGRFDPALAVEQVQPLDQVLERLFVGSRLISSILTGFGILALVLACLGIYGVLSYGVTRRSREIGLRMAVGAGTGKVMGLVVRQSLRLAVFGILLGVPGVLLVTAALSRSLAGVVEIEPMVVLVVALLLVLVIVLAALLPARRAATVDPVEALRGE